MTDKILSISVGKSLVENLNKIVLKEKQKYIENCKTKKEKKKVYEINRSLIINKLIKQGIEVRGFFSLPYGIYENEKEKISFTINENLNEKIEKIVEYELKLHSNPGKICVNKSRVIEDLIIKGISARQIGL